MKELLLAFRRIVSNLTPFFKKNEQKKEKYGKIIFWHLP